MNNLYNDLMTLCQTGDDAFYYVDHTVTEHTKYRVFSYRLASYSDFLKPNALNCRGVMFQMLDSGPLLVSLPMEKFFNLGEMSSDINTLAEQLIKAGRLSSNVYERTKKRSTA